MAGWYGLLLSLRNLVTNCQQVALRVNRVYVYGFVGDSGKGIDCATNATVASFGMGAGDPGESYIALADAA